MKLVMTNPKPEIKWKAIMTMRPVDGDLNAKDAADESGSALSPKAARMENVPSVDSALPVNSE
eukprot:4152492-Pleurochrysis_carterae.AAC.1